VNPRARFAILFTGANKAMAVLGMGPSRSYVDVDDTTVSVRMGWAFRLEVPRSRVRSVAPDHDPVWGWGVHGWRGRWLVNGSSSNLVKLHLDPPAKARIGPVPITVRELRVSVEDPDGLIAALT